MSFRISIIRALPYLTALLIAVLPLFAHLNALPVRLWDESRLAFNALEMARGESHMLVPTFGGAPDMWNTKPPLLIWTQALFMRILGQAELSLRLPSALAALATCFLLVRFADKWLQRPWLGVLAVGVLVTARGYVSLHGVRTGDYEGLMTLFTTGYGLAWFLYCEKADRRMLWTAVACIAGATLTKGVGGLLPLPVLLIYSLLSGKILRQFRDPQLWLAVLSVGSLVAAYYISREGVNPGYLDAVRANELGGRYATVNEAHAAPTRWYVGNLKEYRFRPWILWWGAGLLLGCLSKDRMLRASTLFSVLFCGVHLAVISSAATKLEWYDLPVYPFAAFTAATGIFMVAVVAYKLVVQRNAALRTRPLPLIISLSLFALIPFVSRYRAMLHRVFGHILNDWDPQFETDAAGYLQHMHRAQRAAQIDAFVWKDYYATIAWYRALIYGLHDSTGTASLDSLRPGQRVYTFQPKVQRELTARYAADTVERYKDSVIVYRITTRR